MIQKIVAHEHIQGIKLKSIIFTLTVAIIISALIFICSFHYSPSTFFIISLVLIVMGMNLCVYFIKRTGIATLFYVFTAALTFWIDDFGVLGWKKLLVLFFAGIIFEIIYLIFKIKFHNVPLDIIVGTSLSAASIPFLTAFILSERIASSFPIELLNFILLSFAIGLIASTVTFLFWHHLEHTKPILKLESYLISLDL